MNTTTYTAPYEVQGNNSNNVRNNRLLSTFRGHTFLPRYVVTAVMMLLMLCRGVGNVWGDTHTVTVFSMTSITGPTDNLGSKTSTDVTATFVGGSAIVYNGKSSAISMLNDSNINLSGSGNSYLKISLTGGESIKSGDIITIDNNITADAFYISSSSDTKGSNTYTFPYTVKATDETLVGKSELYFWKNKTSSIGSLNITRQVNGNKITVKTYLYNNGELTESTVVGSVDKNGSYANEGTEVKMTATPNYGYTFSRWGNADGSDITSDANNGTANGKEYTFTMPDAEVTYSAVYIAQKTYSLTASVDDTSHGTITFAPDYKAYTGGEDNAPTYTRNYTEETAVSVTAVPNEGWRFDKWSDNVTTATHEFTMGIDDISVTAQFAKSFLITFNKGTDSEIKGVLQYESAYADATNSYTLPTKNYTLYKEGYTQTGWSTADNGEGTVYALGTKITDISADVNLYPVFTENTVDIYENTSDLVITWNMTQVSGINFSGSNIYVTQATVKGKTIDVKLDINGTFKSNGDWMAFGQNTSFTFPSRKGTKLSFRHYKENYASDCSIAEETLTDETNSSNYYVKSTIDGTEYTKTLIIKTSSYLRDFKITLPPIVHTLSIDVKPSGAGTIEEDTEINYHKSTHSITVTPTYGYKITSIKDGSTEYYTGTDSERRSAFTFDYTVTKDATITATFEKLTSHAINITCIPATGGKVVLESNGTSGITSAVEGDEVILTATPNPGYHFDHWALPSGLPVTDKDGNTITTADKFTILMPGTSPTYQAVFTHPTESHTVTYAVPVDDSGSALTITEGSKPADLTEAYYVMLPKCVHFSVDGYYLKEWKVENGDTHTYYPCGTYLTLDHDVTITPVMASSDEARLRDREAKTLIRWDLNIADSADVLNAETAGEHIYVTPAPGRYTVNTESGDHTVSVALKYNSGTGAIYNSDMDGWCTMKEGATLTIPVYHESEVKLYTYAPISSTKFDDRLPDSYVKTDDGYIYTWETGNTDDIVTEENLGIYYKNLVIGDDYSYYKYVEVDLEAISTEKERCIINTDFNDWPKDSEGNLLTIEAPDDDSVVDDDYTTGDNSPVYHTMYSGESITFTMTSCGVIPNGIRWDDEAHTVNRFSGLQGFIRARKSTVSNASAYDDYDCSNSSDVESRKWYAYNATVVTSTFKNVTRVVFGEGATGNTRGWKMQYRYMTDANKWSDWIDAVTDNVGASNIRVERSFEIPKEHQNNVQLQWVNLVSDQFAFLFDVKVYGIVTTSVEQIPLTMTVDNSAYGSLSVSPEGSRTSTTSSTYTYDKNENVTLKASAMFGYEFDKWIVNGSAITVAQTNITFPDVTTDTTLTVKAAQVYSIQATFKKKNTVFVVYSMGTEATGQAPSTVELEHDEATFTIPRNQTLYLSGSTLDHWVDASNHVYNIGSKYDIGDQAAVAEGCTRYSQGDLRLYPVFRKNTNTLLDVPAEGEATATWTFGQNSAPPIYFNGTKGIFVTQTTVGTETIDVCLDIDATKGKFDNTAEHKAPRLSNIQGNAGTILGIPTTYGCETILETSSAKLTKSTMYGASGTADGKTVDGVAMTKYTDNTTKIDVLYPGKAYEDYYVVNDSNTYYKYLTVKYKHVDDANKPSLNTVKIGTTELSSDDVEKVIAGTYKYAITLTTDRDTLPTVSATSDGGVAVEVKQPTSGNSYIAQLTLKGFYTYTIPFSITYSGYPELKYKGSNVENNATGISRNSTIQLKFNNTMNAGTATLTKSGGTETTLSASSDSTLIFPMWDLEKGATYTFSIPANTLEDVYGQKNTDAISITFTVSTTDIAVTKKTFDFVVGKDGDINAAIAAANSAEGTDRYYIFVPDGEYELTGNYNITPATTSDGVAPADGTGTNRSDLIGKPMNNGVTSINRSAVSLIGQSMDGTTLWNLPTIEGISYTSTVRIKENTTDFYTQDLTFENRFPYLASMDVQGSSGAARAVAFWDRGSRSILRNVALMSYQDTYYSNSGQRGFFDRCKIAGVVDFLCGDGDVWFEQCDMMIRNRSGNNIAAPRTEANQKWGYVLNGCRIYPEEGAELAVDKSYTIGRPWNGSPAVTYLNTKYDILPKDVGWNSMGESLVIRFHEYNSSYKSDNDYVALSLAQRTTAASNPAAGSDECVMTAETAAKYTLRNALGGDDAYDPSVYTVQRPAVSNIAIDDADLHWDDDDQALCYFLFRSSEKDGTYTYVTNLTENTVRLTDFSEGWYIVRAANQRGGLGEATTPLYFTAPETYTLEVKQVGDDEDNFTETSDGNGWSTICLPYNSKVPEGLTVYAGTSVSSYSLILKKVDYINANVGYIAYGPVGEYVFASSSHTTDVTTVLEGNPSDEAIDKDSHNGYVLAYKSTYGLGFYKYTGATLAAHRAWLPVGKVSTATQGGMSSGKAIKFVFADGEEPTGITEIVNDRYGFDNDEVYDINGLKVKTPLRGHIYIINGKKVQYK